MERFFSVLSQQAIAYFIFIVASVLPVYSQELSTAENAQTAVSVAEETTANAEIINRSNPTVVSAQTKSNQTATQPYVSPTGRERFNRYVKNTVGPFSLLRTSVSAGINQWRDHPEEWEQGASGYGKRFASGFGKNAIHHTVIYGLDVALQLDTGFKRSPRKGFGPRFKHALVEHVTSRNKSGKRVISVPRIAGYYTSSVIAAEAWYPERYNYKDGLRSGTRGLITGFGLNLIREFLVSF